LAHLHIIEGEADRDAAEAATRPLAIAYARFSLAATFEGRNVPSRLQAPLADRLAGYLFTQHAKPGEENPNGRLLADRPDLEQYVLGRFAVVGTAEECKQRLLEVAKQASLDGIWLIIVVPNPEIQVTRATSAFKDILAQSSIVAERSGH
jgi:alkanesulfonate monooxygenase SsuD/methylene tetrahydromethanopterin reductase-like flavin-dependent oxidoreductase (luciferase family)